MKSGRLFINLIVISIVSCNMFSASEGVYRENNPNGFEPVILNKDNLSRLSFGTSSREAGSSGAHNPGCVIDAEDLRDDGTGTITITSTNSSNNAGKIAGSEDGIAYYYKKVGKDTNFRLSADFEVIIFGLSNGKADLNGQEGWGIMARDYVPQYEDIGNSHYDLTIEGLKNNPDNNTTKGMYYTGKDRADGPGGSGNMIMVGGVKRGVRVYYRYGVTDPTEDAATNPDTVADASHAKFYYLPREFSDYSIYPSIQARPDYPWGTHILSDSTEVSTGLPVLKYSLTLEKTNNGFKAVIDAPDEGFNTTSWGTVYKGTKADRSPSPGAKIEYGDVDVTTKKAKELGGANIRDLLFSIDKESYYVGFFACRDAKVKISNIQYYEAPKEACAPRIDVEPEIITPSFNVTSPATASLAGYTFAARANVRGVLGLSLNGQALPARQGTWTTEKSNASAEPFENFEIPDLQLKEGPNVFTAVFTPLSDKPDADPDDPEAKMEQLDDAYPVGPAGSYQVLDRTSIRRTFVVEHKQIAGDDDKLYVAPNGRSANNGTRESPLDLITAIDFVRPGQHIIMTDGVYSYKHINIPRYNSGKPKEYEEPLGRLAEVPKDYHQFKYLEAENPDRAIIDFGCPETLKPDLPDVKGFELRGDYWWIEGIHIRNTANKVKGLNIFGKNNVLHQVKTYFNGDSGISIAGSSTEPKALWPSDNTVQYCESFANMDKSREDADGFADKLTAGEGNRFLYCIAHHNADDGWDLFSKKETGGIGPVLLYKCIAYMNGRWLEPGPDDDAAPGDAYPNWHLQNESTKSGGNGFKMGGEGIDVPHEAIDCLSFLNDADGFTSNSDPAILLTHCTGYNNGGTIDESLTTRPGNYAIYGAGAAGTTGLDAVLTHVVSLYAIDTDVGGDRSAFPTNGDRAELKTTATGYLWDGGKTANKPGRELTVENNVVSKTPPFTNWDVPGSVDTPYQVEAARKVQGESAWYANNLKGAFLERDANGKGYKLKGFMQLKDVIGTPPGARDLWQE
ncbi:MAG: hypothetical protein LBH75_05100 [Treponema sp.]|nr:hypothetical protein [Treponema sp.]